MSDSQPARRILYVHNSADIYGASRSLLRLLSRLNRSRFEPVVLLPEDGALNAHLQKLGLEVIIDAKLAVVTRRTPWLQFVLWKFPVSVWRLFRLLRQKQIDLVHTNTGVIVSPGLAARLACVPHIWHVRESFAEFPRRVWHAYARYMQLVSARILCVSHAVMRQFPNDPRILVVHNGFPLDEFAIDASLAGREFRNTFKIADQDFVVACIGRIKFVRKGQEFLLRAAALLREQHVEVTVLIVGAPSPGSEDHMPRLKKLVEQLGLQDRVILTGELGDARPAYAACDVVVLPSGQPEPFGGVVIEAMCMAKPVIATAVGGSPDQVIDGETGFLVPPADAQALASKILFFVQ